MPTVVTYSARTKNHFLGVLANLENDIVTYRLLYKTNLQFKRKYPCKKTYL